MISYKTLPECLFYQGHVSSDMFSFSVDMGTVIWYNIFSDGSNCDM